jgi:hypothetical protein
VRTLFLEWAREADGEQRREPRERELGEDASAAVSHHHAGKREMR